MGPGAARLSVEASAQAADQVLGFSIAARHARGRVVVLGPVLDAILAAHAYPPATGRLLAEALVFTALTGDLLRPDDGQLTVQARGDGGPVTLMVTDWRAGALRGYAAHDLDRRHLAPAGDRPPLSALFGDGYLAITVDQTLSAERYQGIVALGDLCLEEAASHYFSHSEQVPTLVRLAASQRPDGAWTAGGILLQQMSRAEAGTARLHVEASGDDWDHLRALVATIADAELADPGLAPDMLLWRLFHEEEVRVHPATAIHRGCRCSKAHIAAVLGQFPEEERAAMRDRNGVIAVDCEFCARTFRLVI